MNHWRQKTRFQTQLSHSSASYAIQVAVKCTAVRRESPRECRRSRLLSVIINSTRLIRIINDNTAIRLTATAYDPAYQEFLRRHQGEFIVTGLLGGLYGVLAILSVTSCYALLAKRRGKIRLTAIILCLTILALFTSTTIYVVTCPLYYQADVMNAVFSVNNLWHFQDSDGRQVSILWDVSKGIEAIEVLDKYQPMQGCASAATLTVNVILGDAIVCWRACVVWHKSRVAKAICGIFLLATIVLGVVDTNQSCQPTGVPLGYTTYLDIGANVPGSLFEGIPIGIAACVLSLSTNVLATILVAYKAWQCRRRLKGYLVAQFGGSQVEKLFALLAESGAIYSAIWSVVVAYQVGAYKYLNELGPMSSPESNFVDTFGVVMAGTLVPLIAIYPTIIIVLVALNRSHMERGLTQHLSSLPTPHLQVSFAADAVTASLHGSNRDGHRRSAEALVVDIHDSACGDGGEREDARRRTSEERKAEGAVYAV